MRGYTRRLTRLEQIAATRERGAEAASAAAAGVRERLDSLFQREAAGVVPAESLTGPELTAAREVLDDLRMEIREQRERLRALRPARYIDP